MGGEPAEKIGMAKDMDGAEGAGDTGMSLEPGRI